MTSVDQEPCVTCACSCSRVRVLAPCVCVPASILKNSWFHCESSVANTVSPGKERPLSSPVLDGATRPPGRGLTVAEACGCGRRTLRLRGPEQQRTRFRHGPWGPGLWQRLLARTPGEAAGKVQSRSGSSGFWGGAPMWLLAVLQESPQDRATGPEPAIQGESRMLWVT